MELEKSFLIASINEQAENAGLLVNKAGETPVFPPLPRSMEQVMLRGLLGMDNDEPLMPYHLEQARRMYGIELPETETQPE